MEKFLALSKKILSPLFNTRAAGLYMILFAFSIGAATFIENDFGTSSAQKVVFKSWWFELLLLLFAITLVVNIFKYRMIQQKKWAVFLFHFSMIIILIGSGITRYFSFEGMMHIRENESTNKFISSDTYLQFQVIKDGQKYTFDEPVLFATLGNNKWEGSYLVGNDLIELNINEFIPNPSQTLESSLDGKPIIKLVIGGANGRQEYFISQGGTRRIGNAIYNFSGDYIPNAINIRYQNDSIQIRSDEIMTQRVMATQTLDTLYPSSGYNPLKLRSLYTTGNASFVFGDFNESGRVLLGSDDPKVKNESMTALKGTLAFNGDSKDILIYGKKGLEGRPTVQVFDGASMAISYGSKPMELPFHIKLYEFILEKYPGTESAASYASEVQLIDERTNFTQDTRIYMNHILDYGGYRFFQSSFDQDEKGTYLSVNHDFWGTWFSYAGYILLTIGLVMTFFSKKTRFYQVSQKVKKMRMKNAALIFVLAFCSLGQVALAEEDIDPYELTNIVSKAHAAKFSKLAVQDHKGRMKPVHTLSRELLRKLARKERLFNLNADQIILGMLANPSIWNGLKMIKLGKHETIKEKLGVQGELASYNDFFNGDGSYKLREEVRRAYSLQPIDRGVFEKELMKLDERVNIASIIYSGRMLKLIPVVGDPNNTWVSTESAQNSGSTQYQPVADRFFNSYVPALRKATEDDNYTFVDQIISELAAYQKEKGSAVMPSGSRLKAEILLNNLNVFGRLAVYYLLLGLGFLGFLFYSVFRPNANLSKVYKILFGLMVAGFAFHTIGLGLRWYVSGRAPWSNGYESMIYIAWTTTLAGIIFTRRSLGGLAATMVLAATVLLVAMLSYLDPEITPLVPVLKSYWLTIHVSLEAGSYGFLMLGAIIGLINLILLVLLNERNKERIGRMVKEMSYISEMTIMGGLVMVSIGTYLGGVWANESWGRYWGWDAKETWALVTILVYAFILHMRLIPKMAGLYAFNVATLFGWGSVIMTYYGVNYYLSGLHSYAAGDPIPVPSWVYYVVIALVIISVLAFWRKKKLGLNI
jgi:cytochrome c-type biogenesis protein CcsB